MKPQCFYFLSVVLLIACTDKPSTESDVFDNQVNEVSIEAGCYFYNENNDSIYFKVLTSENPIQGNLTYALNEKDRNTGKFEGSLTGDTLIGIYTFKSEGVESKREIAFLVKDNKLLEGYGKLDDNGVSFKDQKIINFSSTVKLVKVPCDE